MQPIFDVLLFIGDLFQLYAASCFVLVREAHLIMVKCHTYFNICVNLKEVTQLYLVLINLLNVKCILLNN